MAQGFARLPQLHEGVAEEKVLLNVCGIEPDRFAIMPDGVGDSAGGLVSGREIAVEIGLVGQLQGGLANQLDGVLWLADGGGHDAEQVERIGLAGLAAQHPAIEGFRFWQPAGLVVLEGLLQSGTQRGHGFTITRAMKRLSSTETGGSQLTIRLNS